MPKKQNVKAEYSNLDKVFWPKEGYTKGDLISYYEKIAPIMLPYLKNRPESMNRFPNGINGKNFYQKDIDHQGPDWVRTEKIYSTSNRKYINYLVCDDKKTLMYMANLGCIEINPWNSRIGKLDYPDFAILDLDPGDIAFDAVIKAAQEIHMLLEQLHVPGFCKTSGATGLHIYIPLGAKYTYEQTKNFAHVLAVLVNKRIPGITSIERLTKKRRGKVYIDYLQNNKGQTLAAPYSVRPRPGATVSAPLEWREVKPGLSPMQFTMKNIFHRIEKKGDLWKGVLGRGVDIEKVLKQIKKLN